VSFTLYFHRFLCITPRSEHYGYVNNKMKIIITSNLAVSDSSSADSKSNPTVFFYVTRETNGFRRALGLHYDHYDWCIIVKRSVEEYGNAGGWSAGRSCRSVFPIGASGYPRSQLRQFALPLLRSCSIFESSVRYLVCWLYPYAFEVNRITKKKKKSIQFVCTLFHKSSILI
jgi:hypothetical protein